MVRSSRVGQRAANASISAALLRHSIMDRINPTVSKIPLLRAALFVWDRAPLGSLATSAIHPEPTVGFRP